MPRSLRIEFPGALYHVMARGNHRQDIFLSDLDREAFLRTLAQACDRTGWRVLAWVLMSNHYHLALETPEPNLVSGMTWFQTTYTRRFNSRHGKWGHLFGDRYKAILVESDPVSDRRPTVNRPPEYLRTLIDYIHLNPVRAGMIAPERNQSLLDYPWSSVAKGYALPPSRRPSWLDAGRGLGLVDCPDRSHGRRRYVERLDRRAAAEEAHRCGLPESEVELGAARAAGPSLRRGWYWGSDRFRERMTDLAQATARKQQHKTKLFSQSRQARDHRERMAEEIVAKALAHYEIETEEELRRMTGRRDWRRVSVAWAIWSFTSVRQEWIAARMNLRNAANASQQIRRFRLTPDSELPKGVRQWKQVVSKIFT